MVDIVGWYNYNFISNGFLVSKHAMSLFSFIYAQSGKQSWLMFYLVQLATSWLVSWYIFIESAKTMSM